MQREKRGLECENLWKHGCGGRHGALRFSVVELLKWPMSLAD